MQDNNNEIIISVVVLTYNQEQTIMRTLDSILSQQTTYSYEVIIGEDASPNDNTREVCEKYAEKYPKKIHLMPKAPNKGLMKNYRDCLAKCKGRYIGCCAGDDWWHNPNKLQIQVSFLEENPDYGIVHTDHDTFYENSGNVISAFLTKRPAEGNVFRELLKSNFITAPTCLYRRELLNYVDIDKYISAGIMMEDYPMWLEMSQHTKVHYINCSSATYSVMNNSLSHSTDIHMQLEFIHQSYIIQSFFLKRYPQPDLAEEWLDMIYHRMRYMLYLTYGKYKQSFTELPYIGIGKFKQHLLASYVGAVVSRWVLNCKLYKIIKGY